MKLQEFKQKKHWKGFVDLKKLAKDFNKNEKDRKKYFALVGRNKKECYEARLLKGSIIW